MVILFTRANSKLYNATMANRPSESRQSSLLTFTSADIQAAGVMPEGGRPDHIAQLVNTPAFQIYTHEMHTLAHR